MAFYKEGWPVISVDTKKKELIGNYHQAVRKWLGPGPGEEEVVNDHDWPSEAVGRAVPYGIYDVRTKKGSVYIGDSADTAEFAVGPL